MSLTWFGIGKPALWFYTRGLQEIVRTNGGELFNEYSVYELDPRVKVLD